MCLCTFFFFFFLFSFFFFFFLNCGIIDVGTKSCMQLALWHIKNLNSKTNKESNKSQTKHAKTLQAGSSEPYRISLDD